MSVPFSMLAQVNNIPVPPAGSKAATFIFSDVALIFLAAGAIMLAILVWVLVVRGPKQQGRSRRIYKESQPSSDEDEEKGTGRRRKKRRVRRREHRSRNPTLAETGGLPEPRPPGVPPSI